jgi:MFS transporter, DHA1 family, multidrug resistance protein
VRSLILDRRFTTGWRGHDARHEMMKRALSALVAYVHRYDAEEGERLQASAFLLLCTVGGLAIFSSTIAKNPILPILAQQLGADKGTIGLVAAASTLTGILASLPAGLLSDRWGRKRLLLGAGIVFVSAPLAYLLVTTPAQLAVVRAYHGLATAVLGPVAMAYVTDLAPTHRGERLGWYASTTLAGRTLAPVAGGTLLAFGPWQWVYILCGMAGGLALLGMWWLPTTQADPSPAAYEAARIPEGSSSASLWTILYHRTILVTSAAEASQFMAFGAVEAFLPLYALSVGVDKATVGLLFGAQIGMKTLARPLMGKISDRHGRTRQIILGLMLTGITTALFPHTRITPLLLVLSAGFGLGIAIASAATSAFVADLAPEHGRGTALGTMSTIMDVGQAFGPILLGTLLTRVSYAAGFAVIALLVIVAAVLFAIMAAEASPAEIPKEE